MIGRVPARRRQASLLALRRVAKAHEREGRLEDALAGWRRVVEVRPRSPDVLNRIGDLLDHLGRTGEAVSSWSAAAHLQKEDGFLLKAGALFRKASRRDPGNVDLLLEIADVHADLGHRPDAIRLYLEVAGRWRAAGQDSRAVRVFGKLKALEVEGVPAVPEVTTAPATREVTAAAEVARRLDRAAEIIRSATALVVAAGAELNTDFGWPDYRHSESLWADFPAYRTLGLRFEDLARPAHFELDPALVWGFYGRRRELARERPPHEGLRRLARWRALCPAGGYVVTSLVDGEFSRAGFDAKRMVECCGSIEWTQCAKECGAAPYPASKAPVAVDPGTLRARDPLPSCPDCGGMGRPNVLLLGDWGWDLSRATAQEDRLRAWLEGRSGLVVLDCGETPQLPELRFYVDRIVRETGAPLVRIRKDAVDVPEGGVLVPLGPREGLERLDERIRQSRPSGP